MANLFQWLRFWIPAIARKGGRTHIRAVQSSGYCQP